MAHAKGAKHLKVNELKSDSVRNAFNSKMAEVLSQRWSSSLPAQDKFVPTIVESTKEVAQQYLPVDNKRVADWFKENEHIIQPALEREVTCLEHGCPPKLKQIGYIM